MNPICEEKIKCLQKYVPCLANLIELLSNDSEKEGKLAQMKLLYNVLSKPDESIKIETLEKCEETLSRVFGSGEKKHNDAEIKETIDEIIPIVIKNKVIEELDKSAEVFENVNGCSEEGSSSMDHEKSLNIHAPNTETNCPQHETTPSETPPTKDELKIDHENLNGSAEISQPSNKCTANGDEPVKEVETSANEEELTKVLDLEAEVEGNHSDTGKISDEVPEEKTLLIAINENSLEENVVKDIGTSDTNNLNEELLEENSLLIKINENPHKESLVDDIGTSDKRKLSDEFPEENSLLIAINDKSHEENLVEEIVAQVDESDTFILPDDGESRTFSTEETHVEKHDAEDLSQEEKLVSETELEEQQSGVIMQRQMDMLPFKIISAESLAVQSVHSFSENEDINDHNPLSVSRDQENVSNVSEDQLNITDKEGSKDNDDLDPLDPKTDLPEKLLTTHEPASASEVNGPIRKIKTYAKEKVDEDDDVLLIENRSSPICIDSDPEDEENMKKFPIIAPRKASISPTKAQQKQHQRTNARKSTMETIRNIIKQQNVSIRKVVSSVNKPKTQRNSGYLVKKDPKALMETINLIDSDSDDEKTKKPQSSKSNDDDVIIVSSSQPPRKLVHLKKTTSVQSSKQATRFLPKSEKKHAAKSTAQSNFLNAVNLQPATGKSNSNSNPATFSAQLSNKKVIIPNAFYGNPSYNRKLPSSSSVVPACVDDSSSNDSAPRICAASSQVGIRQSQDKVIKEWLEGFLTNFASPLQIASHACFVLLQRVLKYRFFQRLKETRVNLNTLAKNVASETMDVQMLLDLRSQFLDNDILTEAGRRFCRFATNDAFGKPVALTTDSRTGKVTCRTRIGSKVEIPVEVQPMTKPNIPEKAASTAEVPAAPRQTQIIATVTSASTPPSIPAVAISSFPKRKGKLRKLSDGILVAADNDDNDYTPSKSDQVPQEEFVTERKKSLRTNRTKRKEAGFTYSEDHDDEEFEALAKKLEDKKREELRLAEERELEKEKEWERKMKKTVAKKTTSKRQDISVELPKGPTRKKLRLADKEIVGNADDDLLTPTWVEADADDGEVDSLLDFADEPQSPETQESENDNIIIEEDPVSVKAQDSHKSDSYPSVFDVNTNKSLKNTDRALHAHSQSFDFCVHCLRRVPRTVHHYVNEHRSSEVYTSRLRTKDIRRLLTTSNVGFVHLYKGNQQQYAAHCIFCDKEAKFLYPYWFEHFTMHTGEYSFKCSGCQILKPTRSLLTNHLQSGSGCLKKGTTVRLHIFDTKSNQIEAHICSLCNYVQLHRSNLLRHLETQHQVVTVSPNHIIKVVLLQVSGPYRDQEEITNDISQLSLLQNSDDEDINGASFDENSLMMQNDFTDNDDLSFMICGMLDVQTDMSATGELVGNVDTTNTVDNK